MTAQTNQQKQAALRKRRADLGLKEMRGIWVTDDEEIEVKKKVRAMITKMRK